MTMTDTVSTPAPVFSVPQERRIVTAVPGPKSQELHQRRLAVVPTGVSSALPVYIARANGAILVDVDGNQFVDFGAGIGVTTVGHTETAVVEAAAGQLQDVIHTLFTITPYEEYVRVAELLAEHTPGDHAKKTVLVNSGAEAVENGVKIARKFTGRRAVAVLDHAYHGRTNLTMAMNYKAMPYATGFGPFAGDVYHAPNSYPYRDGLSGAEAAARTIAYLEKVVGASDLACLVAEPIQGEGGFIVPAEGYLSALQDWCTANGVVFIADEIQSGMARTGAFYASEHFGVVPDLVLSAKGIAGGLPLAAVTGRAEIMDSAQPGGLGGTFGGNPVAAAAAVAVFETIERNDLLAEARRIESALKPALEKLQQKYDIIGDVRGIGAMIAVELVKPGTAQTTKEPNPEAVNAIIQAAAQQGILFLNAGTWGNVLRFLPSLAVSDELIADAVSVIDDAIAAL
ncbi:4-aminobutyrate aminotransferase apoenzyme [Leifsonia sp. 98AMF]|nr:4-aminobutyrate aminotransferase apoenzyme [Leifsonia sp. 197AMF]SDJ03684.1 4-aminobutyrate aminotransferase apoenzyme [Leifsonia sp. 466MF]SDJ69109.1 4-aminobutyrate aminotransferase apoenzyme [Leifsonia sp. 157MF]SDO07495.1 4-aminobutyrate aminotransferase apoenzyme [Leifsonia sp. 509MF]SEM96390.1 4-aminobutyrate aminotransferase apoenzyme [Leifsonia sp. 467MF]SFM24887.1 4-aminobutyrate aminotransferase apoenzyme [Leifsonia sp. 98AMF]